MSTHRADSHAARASSAKAAAWSVLVTMGGTSVTLNIYDATHSKPALMWLIAGLRGFAPVFAAMGLSEAAARFDGGKTFRGVAFAIMTGAMLLSASAVANVLRPSYPAGLLGLGLSWLFGVVLDAAALAGLWMILTERERRREAERQGEADDAAQAMAEVVAAAEARTAELAQAERVRLEAEAAEARAAVEAELATVRTELAAANATAEALRERGTSARKRRRSSARKPAATSARKPAGTSGPEPGLSSAGSSGPDDLLDVDAEATLLALIEEGKSPTDARILALIAAGHSASEAGVLAGKSDGYGRQVARLHRPAPKEPAGDARTEGDMS